MAALECPVTQSRWMWPIPGVTVGAECPVVTLVAGRGIPAERILMRVRPAEFVGLLDPVAAVQ